MDQTHAETTTQKRRRWWISKPVETEELSEVGVASRRAAPRRPGLAMTAVAVLGLLGLTVGCKVPSPTVQQGLDYGFRTPKQAFESWRTAVQGDLLAEEYGCFTRLWKAKHGGVSLMAYAEARDQIAEEYPHLQWAIYKAEAPEEHVRTETDSLLVARIPGPLWVKDRYLYVRMRRQGFWELSAEDLPLEPFAGDEVPDPVRAGIFYADEKGDRFFAIINDFEDQTRSASMDSINLVRAGWEWKILDFKILDEPVDAALFQP